MAEFLTHDELKGDLFETLQTAKKELFIVSPYFKISDSIKLILDQHSKKSKFKLRILFGKNPNEKEKSLSKTDLDYLKGFSNVEIKYNQNLHAKYFATRTHGIVTSLNFHEYSIENNLEVGTRFDYNWLEDLIIKIPFRWIDSDYRFEVKARAYFNQVFEHSDPVFKMVNSEIDYDFIEKHFAPKEKSSTKSTSSNLSNSNKTLVTVKQIAIEKGWDREVVNQFLLDIHLIEKTQTGYRGTSKAKDAIETKKMYGKEYVLLDRSVVSLLIREIK